MKFARKHWARSGGGQQAGDTQEKEEEELEHDDLTEAVRGTLSVAVRPEAFIERKMRSARCHSMDLGCDCQIFMLVVCIHAERDDDISTFSFSFYFYCLS